MGGHPIGQSNLLPSDLAVRHRQLWAKICHVWHDSLRDNRELIRVSRRSELIHTDQSILLEIFARNWQVYAIAKLFSGAASGWLGPSLMSYLSEISMPQFRGILLSAFSLFLAIGGFTNAIASQIVNSSTPMLYRRLFYSEFFYLGAWIIPILVLPESPCGLSCMLFGYGDLTLHP